MEPAEGRRETVGARPRGSRWGGCPPRQISIAPESWDGGGTGKDKREEGVLGFVARPLGEWVDSLLGGISDECFRFAPRTEALVQHGGVGRVKRAGTHGAGLDAGAALGAARDVGRGTPVLQADGSRGQRSTHSPQP